MTIAQLQAETRRIYKVYRSYGWEPGVAEQAAAEYYGYQMSLIRKAAEPLHRMAMAYRERSEEARA